MRRIAIIALAAVTPGVLTVLVSPSAHAAPLCLGKRATIVGTRGGDFLRGTGRRDVIVARGGRDRIYGRGGGDFICGGNGNDRIAGQGDRDRVAGGRGADRIDGGGRHAGTSRYEILKGGGGDDVIRGGGGRDKLVGGSGADRLFGDGHGDLIFGGVHDDHIDTGDSEQRATHDTAFGGPGNDEIVSLDWGQDILKAGDGDDVMTGAPRSYDEMHGGPGNDRYEHGLISFEGAIQGVTADLIVGTAVGEGADVLVSGEGIIGSNFDDVLRGSEEGDLLRGGAGKDEVDGRAGPDGLYAGTGVDILQGGPGDDELFDIENPCSDVTGCGSEPDDTFHGGEGTDSIDFEAAIGVHVDLFYGAATGAGADALIELEDVIGTSHNDTLLGDDLANRLDAASGSDVLVGRGGDDQLVELSNFDPSSAGDGFFGGAGDDMLWVFYGDNSLHGGPGADKLIGGDGGHDSLYGDEGDDVLVGSDRDDLLDGGEGSDTADYSRAWEINVDLGAGRADKPYRSEPARFGTDRLVSVENAVATSRDDVLIGSDVANHLFGGTGSDTIGGAGGDDFLDGGIGGIPGSREPDHDVLDGGAGTDSCTNGESTTDCEA